MEVNGGDEIEELKPCEELKPSEELNPNANTELRRRTVRTVVPEVDVKLYRRGTGPIATFRSPLGGWDQDRLEVQDILDKYGLKSIYSFNPSSGRGVSIRFNPKNGRSILPYSDGSSIIVDGEPKDSLVKPITKISVSASLIVLVISIFVKETPDWLKKLKLSTGMFPPWVLACAVVVFARLMKRTKGLLSKYRR